MIDYAQGVVKKDRKADLKCAVFMSGSAPFTADGKNVLLADEHGQVINRPALLDGMTVLSTSPSHCTISVTKTRQQLWVMERGTWSRMVKPLPES